MIDIRRLTPDDAALYRDIRLEALQNEPTAFSSTYDLEKDRPLDAFATRLTEAAVFAALDNGTLAGVAGFYIQAGPKHGHKGMLWGMYVRPTYRGRATGTAQRLVETVIEHARRHVELLQLFVVADNIPARRLYTRLGFVKYGIERRATKFRGEYHDDVLMALAFDDSVPEDKTR